MPGRGSHPGHTGDRPSWVRRVAEIGAAVPDAPTGAHAAQIVHRDIKPGNVPLAKGRVVLADFGIAHLTDATTELSRSGIVIGTPQYTPPEQLDGKRPTPANGLGALGTTRCHAVEGRLPFEAEGLHAPRRGRVHPSAPAAGPRGPARPAAGRAGRQGPGRARGRRGGDRGAPGRTRGSAPSSTGPDRGPGSAREAEPGSGPEPAPGPKATPTPDTPVAPSSAPTMPGRAPSSAPFAPTPIVPGSSGGGADPARHGVPGRPGTPPVVAAPHERPPTLDATAPPERADRTSRGPGPSPGTPRSWGRHSPCSPRALS